MIEMEFRRQVHDNGYANDYFMVEMSIIALFKT